MNEFLLSKFREQEDLKNSVRDTQTYIKLHMPLVTQMQINDQIVNLLKIMNTGVDAAGSENGSPMGFIDEEKLFNYQGLKLESLLQNISLEKGRAEKAVESNPLTKTSIQPSHLTEMMIKHALPKEEVNKKKQSAEDFVVELIKEQMED